LRGRKSRPPGYPQAPETVGEHLKKARLDRSLWHKHLAHDFGCSISTIQNYEKGRTAPDLRHWPAILHFLGYDPRPVPTSWPERLRHAREGRGLTQGELGALLGVEQETVSRWEIAKDPPRLIGRAKKAVQAFLGER
jgi:transcriptional regulator with XRE-family HTH domain